MSKNYVYKLKHKYIKHPELLEVFGFNPYKDEEGAITYALGIQIPEDCSIVKYLIKAFEQVYKHADDKEEFKDYTFSKTGKLRVTKKVKNEFTKCQLCVPADGIGANTLYINAPDRVVYDNSLVLDECCKDIVDILVLNRVVYKKRSRNA